jgi:hypothetical protein
LKPSLPPFSSIKTRSFRYCPALRPRERRQRGGQRRERGGAERGEHASARRGNAADDVFI